MAKRTKKRTTPAPKGGKVKKKTKGPQKKCAKGSVRFVEPPGRPEVRIVICCPPGKWAPKKKWKQGKQKRVGKCAVGMKQHLKVHYTLPRKRS